MQDVGYLTKDDHIQFKQTNYKAISEEKVTKTVRESLVKHGLIILPIEQEHSKDGNLSTVNVKYKIINIDNGEYETIVSSGTGADTQDKGVGKAMTYAYKYLLLRTFAIPTGEDPDKVSSAELDEKQGGNPNVASEKQLNYVNKLLKGKTSEKHPYQKLYEGLKARLNTDADIENWTSQQASQAINMLQGDKS